MAASTNPRERDNVVEWRRTVLRDAGYSRLLAGRIAASDADLHKACELIRKGCEPRVAARILL